MESNDKHTFPDRHDPDGHAPSGEYRHSSELRHSEERRHSGEYHHSSERHHSGEYHHSGEHRHSGESHHFDSYPHSDDYYSDGSHRFIRRRHKRYSPSDPRSPINKLLSNKWFCALLAILSTAILVFLFILFLRLGGVV